MDRPFSLFTLGVTTRSTGTVSSSTLCKTCGTVSSSGGGGWNTVTPSSCSTGVSVKAISAAFRSTGISMRLEAVLFTASYSRE